MLIDIELLKQDFLSYLNLLISPSPESLVEKIHSALQETGLKEVKINSDNKKVLFINKKNKIECSLSKSDLETFGLSIEDFIKSIEDIKNKDPNKLIRQAIEDVVTLHNKKLYEIYIPQAILAYTNLYEKFKTAFPTTDKDKIYDLMDKLIEDLLTNEKKKLTYNYFKRGYQGFQDSSGFASIFTSVETDDLRIVFDITKKLKINFTSYQAIYLELINSIEELHLYTGNKATIEALINELKLLTNVCFLELIQIPSLDQDKKLAVEKIVENFKLKIEEYIENHPEEYKKQRSILAKLLWLITKLIPSSILSENRRMTLFGDYTKNGMQIKNLSNQFDEYTSIQTDSEETIAKTFPGHNKLLVY